MPAQDDLYVNGSRGETIFWGREPVVVEQSAPVFSPTIEITAVNGSPSQANRFDVWAVCTFTHRTSGRQVVVPAYYTGSGNTWVWRFAGDEPGIWEYETRADGTAGTTNDPDLHGRSGAVEVVADSQALGFVTHLGNRWAIMRGRYDVLETFVPQLVMIGAIDGTVQDDVPPSVYDTAARRDAFTAEFIGPTSRHGFTGCHLVSVSRYWFDAGAASNALDGSETDPDPQFFATLEALIDDLRAIGAVVHIWPWGDQQRSLSPNLLPGGINGTVDLRLQRYIAARLGCVPGWTMGYGFDLDEWVTEDELHAWRDSLQAKLPYRQLLGGRPGGPNPEDGGTNSDFLSWNSGMDYASYEHHRPDHAQYADALAQFSDRPAFSEDRFRVRQDAGFDEKDYTEEMTYQGLWVSTIAGGVANIWGHLDSDTTVADTGVYTVRDQINTYSRFWFGDGRRFDRVREKDDALTTAGWLLHAADFSAYAIYAQGVASLDVDLSSAPGQMRVVAVDTTAPYQEIDLGTVAPGVQTINLPSTSEWGLWIEEAA